MTADEARLVWRTIAIIAGCFASVGMAASAYGLWCSYRRQPSSRTERIVTTRDLLMMWGHLSSASLGLGTAILLVWLSFHYSRPLDAVLEELAVPIVIAYIGFALVVFFDTTASPIWVVTRYLALLPRARARNKRAGIPEEGG